VGVEGGESSPSGLAVAILALVDAVDVVLDFGLRAGEDFHIGHPERGANDLWLVE
jgi:hypothetical protein